MIKCELYFAVIRGSYRCVILHNIDKALLPGVVEICEVSSDRTEQVRQLCDGFIFVEAVAKTFGA
jgi:hypothetical protein